MAGFLVLGIDYFFGDGFGFHLDEEGFDRMAWIDSAKKKSREVYPKWLETVRKTYGMRVGRITCQKLNIL